MNGTLNRVWTWAAVAHFNSQYVEALRTPWAVLPAMRCRAAGPTRVKQQCQCPSYVSLYVLQWNQWASYVCCSRCPNSVMAMDNAGCKLPILVISAWTLWCLPRLQYCYLRHKPCQIGTVRTFQVGAVLGQINILLHIFCCERVSESSQFSFR
jgi:hypothetical protein